MGLFGRKKERRAFVFITKNIDGNLLRIEQHLRQQAFDNDKVYNELLNEYYIAMSMTMGRQTSAVQSKIKDAKSFVEIFSSVTNGIATLFFPQEWDMGIGYPKEPDRNTNSQLITAVKNVLKKHFNVGWGVSVGLGVKSIPLGDYTIFKVSAKVAEKD